MSNKYKFDNDVLKTVEAQLIKDGVFKSELMEKTASSRPSFSNLDLLGKISALSDSLRSEGFVERADALDSKLLNYKLSQDSLNRFAEKKMNSMLEDAHPEGDVELLPSEHGYGVIETADSQQRKMLEVFNKPVKVENKKAKQAFEDVENFLLKKADVNSDLESYLRLAKNKMYSLKKYFHLRQMSYFNNEYPGVLSFVLGTGKTLDIYKQDIKVDLNSTEGKLLQFYMDGLKDKYKLDELLNGEYKTYLGDIFNKTNSQKANNVITNMTELFEKRYDEIIKKLDEIYVQVKPPQTLNVDNYDLLNNFKNDIKWLIDSLNKTRFDVPASHGARVLEVEFIHNSPEGYASPLYHELYGPDGLGDVYKKLEAALISITSLINTNKAKSFNAAQKAKSINKTKSINYANNINGRLLSLATKITTALNTPESKTAANFYKKIAGLAKLHQNNSFDKMRADLVKLDDGFKDINSWAELDKWSVEVHAQELNALKRAAYSRFKLFKTSQNSSNSYGSFSPAAANASYKNLTEASKMLSKTKYVNASNALQALAEILAHNMQHSFEDVSKLLVSVVSRFGEDSLLIPLKAMADRAHNDNVSNGDIEGLWNVFANWTNSLKLQAYKIYWEMKKRPPQQSNNFDPTMARSDLAIKIANVLQKDFLYLNKFESLKGEANYVHRLYEVILRNAGKSFNELKDDLMQSVKNVGSISKLRHYPDLEALVTQIDAVVKKRIASAKKQAGLKFDGLKKSALGPAPRLSKKPESKPKPAASKGNTAASPLGKKKLSQAQKKEHDAVVVMQGLLNDLGLICAKLANMQDLDLTLKRDYIELAYALRSTGRKSVASTAPGDGEWGPLTERALNAANKVFGLFNEGENFKVDAKRRFNLNKSDEDALKDAKSAEENIKKLSLFAQKHDFKLSTNVSNSVETNSEIFDKLDIGMSRTEFLSKFSENAMFPVTKNLFKSFVNLRKFIQQIDLFPGTKNDFNFSTDDWAEILKLFYNRADRSPFKNKENYKNSVREMYYRLMQYKGSAADMDQRPNPEMIDYGSLKEIETSKSKSNKPSSATQKGQSIGSDGLPAGQSFSVENSNIKTPSFINSDFLNWKQLMKDYPDQTTPITALYGSNNFFSNFIWRKRQLSPDVILNEMNSDDAWLQIVDKYPELNRQIDKAGYPRGMTYEQLPQTDIFRQALTKYEQQARMVQVLTAAIKSLQNVTNTYLDNLQDNREALGVTSTQLLNERDKANSWIKSLMESLNYSQVRKGDILRKFNRDFNR